MDLDAFGIWSGIPSAQTSALGFGVDLKCTYRGRWPSPNKRTTNENKKSVLSDDKILIKQSPYRTVNRKVTSFPDCFAAKQAG